MTTFNIKYSRGLASLLESAKTLEPEAYIELLKTNADVYEYIPDDRPVKLYFDIDLKGDADAYDGELKYTDRVIEIAKMGIDTFVGAYFNEYNIKPQYSVSQSCSIRFIDCQHKKPLWKLSLHIVVNNIVAMKTAQNYLIKKMNVFMLAFDKFGEDIAYELRAIFNDDNVKLFDDSVYSKNRKIRAVGSSKPGENRPLAIVEGTIEESVISGFMPASTIQYFEPEDTATKPTIDNATPTINKDDFDYKKTNDFIMEGIFDERAKEYKTWTEMAFALYNSFGTVNGWVLFDEFSKRYMTKYDVINNRNFWDKLVDSIQPTNKLTIKSIIKWARDDDKDAATRIIEKYKKQMQRIAKSSADDEDDSALFREMSKEFERTHAKIINRAIFIKENENEVILMSRNELKTAYEHKSCGKKKKFIDLWMLCNDDIRNYDDMDIYPDASLCPERIYNLWRPFKIDTYKGEYEPNPGALDIIFTHIKILCDHDTYVFNYIVLWIAHMLKHPARKSIVPTFISRQGAGKGTLMKLLTRLLGEKRVLETAAPSRDVWGNFNALMPTKFLINLNELTRKETMESEGRIKALITDPTLTINPKGTNQYEIKSYHRFIITTNNEHPVTTSEDDRRNLIIRSSDEKIGDKNYFLELNALLDDDNVIRTVGDAFKSMDVNANFNEYPIPKTTYQNDLKEASTPTHELWLAHFTILNKTEKSVCRFPSEIYNEYMEWSNNNGFCNNGMNSVKFGVRLNNIFSQTTRKQFIETEQSGAHKKTFHIKALLSHFKIN